MKDLELCFCDMRRKEFLMAIERFHGWLAPGMVLGGVMVDLALGLLDTFSDPAAVVETNCYLPDAVQLFTPCTVGNGRMAVLNWGKTALSLYDKTTSAGYRIWLDLIKVRAIPDLYNWQMRLVPPKKQQSERLITLILSAGHGVFSWRPVPVIRPFAARIDSAMAVCPRCDEAYPAIQGERCLSCQGKTYFEIPEKDITSFQGETLKSTPSGPEYCSLI